MTEPRRTAEDVLNEWGRQVVPLEDAEIAEERRARVVSRIAGNIRETANHRIRSSRRARFVLGLVAAALLVGTGVLAFVTREQPRSHSTLIRAGQVGIDSAAERARVTAPGPIGAEAADSPALSNTESVPAAAKEKRALASRETAPESKLTASDLAEQNRLFAAARAATRRGDDRSAIASLDQLLSSWPKSPLAPEARVERFRALKRIGNADEAAREARRYLLEQKDGPARQEARDLALEPDQSLH